jgi:hypothetical protein
MKPRPTDRLSTLDQVTEEFQWSRRTPVRLLRKYGIATIGTGRRGRLAVEDVEVLQVKEREAARIDMPPPEPPKATSPGRINASSMHERMRQYWRRRLGQIDPLGTK